MSATLFTGAPAAAPLAGGTRATCPLCHTADSTVTDDALSSGADWRCSQCGQSWSARRLATVAAYETWAAAYSDGRRDES